ncbi:MAG: HIT domain-containing protein [Anaerolineales bacterium]|nr:HIT domain-containing protein [Anaerolineales bacterium]
MVYIQSHKKENCCPLCVALDESECAEPYIVVKSEHAFVILNRYPYTSGHLMVVPYDHVSSIDKLSCETRSEMMELVNHAIQVLQAVYCPEGFNVGMNIGEAAGAGIADHVHVHVVPRWEGDTNFMSSLAQTRVLPESLEETHRRIKEAW